MEIILKENNSCEVRYRYDWHRGAKPPRYSYNNNIEAYALNELAFELKEGEYGRAICNGRFVGNDTGLWWYEISIVNIMLTDKKSVPLDYFVSNTPTHYYRQMAILF